MAGEVNELMGLRIERDMWKDQVRKIGEKLSEVIARAENAEAFIADFAAFTFTEAPRPYVSDPQDEPDEYVDAQEVWLWQSDAKDLLK